MRPPWKRPTGPTFRLTLRALEEGRQVAKLDIARGHDRPAAIPVRRLLEGQRRFRLEEIVPEGEEPRPDHAGRGQRLVGHEVDRHDDVRFDLDHEFAGLGGQPSPPSALRPQVAAIADDDARFLPECRRDLVRRTTAHNERDPTFPEPGCDFGQALEHEGVVAKIRVRVRIGQTEAYQEGLIALVGETYRVFEGMIAVRTLRLLHPIKDVAASNGRSVIEVLNAFGSHGRSLQKGGCS